MTTVGIALLEGASCVRTVTSFPIYITSAAAEKPHKYAKLGEVLSGQLLETSTS